jgi:hypothetical protein
MSRRRGLIAGYMAGAASVMLALYVSVLLGPVAVGYTDAEAVVTAAVKPVLSEFPAGTAVYVQHSPNPPTLGSALRPHGMRSAWALPP